MVIIKGRIRKVGNSYGILIPTALVRNGIISSDGEIEVEIKDSKTLQLEEEVKLLRSKLENHNQKNSSPPVEGFTSFLVPSSHNSFHLTSF